MALVNQEQVGIIFAYDVTRLARNCTDWYQLLDLCGYRCCLVGDQDGIYDPATPNGRLILGPQGLDLRTGAAYPARPPDRRTPQQGPTRRTGPGRCRSGWSATPWGGCSSIPTRKSRTGSIWSSPPSSRSRRRAGSCSSSTTATCCCPGGIASATWSGGGQPPRPSCPSSRTPPMPVPSSTAARGPSRGPSAPHQRVQKPLPMDQWKVCLRDKYPAYIGWDTFERIQAMVRDNYSEYDRNKSRGVPRPGKALLHGIVYCGECGHKMVVQYKSGGPLYLQLSPPAVPRARLPEPARRPHRRARRRGLPRCPVPGGTGPVWQGRGRPPPGTKSRSSRRSGSRSSGSATRPAWPSGSTTRPTRTTAWWPPSWSGVGKRRCGNSRTPRSGSGASSSNPKPPRASIPRNEKPSSGPARRSRSSGVRTA